MRTLVHLSDLHFGRIDDALLHPLVKTVQALAPDVVVVSGDLTQRALRREFIQARAFLDQLPRPQIVVPGNHDVPLYNLVKRLFRPLAHFQRYIEPDLIPQYIDGEIAVVGINTARAMVLKNGRVNAEQIGALSTTLGALGEQVLKVVVTHHPFAVPASASGHAAVGRAGLAMAAFARCGVDVLLAGHLHASHTVGAGIDEAPTGHAALLVSAGTATSTRGRGETNSFNVLRLERQQVEVQRYAWQAARQQFLPEQGCVYVQAGGRWVP